MTHGSLFSGIGGFDLAAEWMGWENIFHCEWNKFGQKVLKYYWPNAISYENICTTDFTVHRGQIDILTGGFPCQPYSTAGKRLGKADERHLFPEMLRCIKEIKPRWIIGENVRGLVSWNGGLVFQEVYDDLEREGYEVQSFLIPAASVNAPHRRDRIWFVAYTNNERRSNGFRQVQRENGEVSQWNNNAEFSDTDKQFVANTMPVRLQQCENTREMGERQKEMGRQRCQFTNGFETNGKISNVANTNSANSEAWTQREILGQQNRQKANGYSDVECENKWQNFPTVSPICNGDDGLSDRLDNITFPKWRNESIKAGGNAIVPQVAYQIFKTIQEYERIAVTDKNPQAT
jgi:DNA (cytosine-5)-methyltransferase 1